MHYRAIFKYDCFRLFCERRETLLPCFDSYFSQNRTRVVVVFCLIHCENDFLTYFTRRLKSLDRSDGNEN